MSTVSTVLTDVRYFLEDPASTRYTDSQLIAYLGRAINRAKRVLQNNRIEFAKKKASLTTAASTATVSLPADFDTIPQGPVLFRDATHEEIPILNEFQFERLSTAGVLENARLDIENSTIIFNGTPDAVETVTMYYYPTVATSSLTLGSTMPWGGKIDDLLSDYVVTRAANVDEFNVQVDMALLTELEDNILRAYRNLTPQQADSRGWLVNAEV